MPTLFDVDIARDVRTVESMVAHITPYIYEDELYGVLPNNLPRLTIGSLLMRFHRLAALPDLLSESQKTVVVEARQKFAESVAAWPVAYETKIAQELKARLVALGQFLAECEERPRNAAEGYPSAMEKRVMVELLKDEADARGKWTDEFNGALSNIDSRIRRFFEKGEFCWDKRVEAAYPSEKFWFLHGLPPRPNTKAR